MAAKQQGDTTCIFRMAAAPSLRIDRDELVMRPRMQNLIYLRILSILGSDFGTPVALSATKPIPVFQYLFVALCATY